MRLLIACDIHGNEKKLANLLQRDFDYLIIAGDLTNFMREMHLFDILPKNSIFVPGNNEKLLPGFKHGEIVKLKGIKIACLGGSLPTPFSTLFEIGEKEYEEICSKLKDFDLLISHSPPFGVLDKVNSKHIGSKAIRELIEEVEPLAAFVGHVHEYFGSMAFLGKVPIINPGPLGFLLEL